MNRAFVAMLLVILPGCAERGSGGAEPGGVGFQDVTADPEAFDGREVRIETGYFGSFEISVLTSGFAESYPPQPVEPMIWVAAGPPEECLERAQGTVWSEHVVATGTFRYDPDNGFGHLGAYPMALKGAEVDCG